jgi:hypothetical protein
MEKPGWLPGGLIVFVRTALAVMALAIVTACSSTSSQRASALPPPPVADAPVASGVVGASGVTFGNAPPPPATPVDPVRIDEDKDPSTIVTTGRLEDRPVSPDGDPRNAIQRRQDARAWDRCILSVQRQMAQQEGVNPVGNSPEEYCARTLGMSSRDAVPNSRR